MTVIIDGTGIARQLRAEVAARVEEFVRTRGRRPGLATVLVGNDPASEVYVRNKRRSAAAAGIVDQHRHLPAETSQAELQAHVGELAEDPAVSGILVQLPLPAPLDPAQTIGLIPWHKDVDGLTTTSAGLLYRRRPGLRPCTPTGVVTLLDAASIPLVGAQAVVVGWSELVGRPLAHLLAERGASVTIAHSRTRDLAALTGDADIVVVAAGVRGLVGREHIREGAAVIDVGIHRTADGKLCGDVRFDELVGHASHLTPVPGGVGPMTIAELLRNTVKAAELAGVPVGVW
jgi:methylenetetrahydrofolate dehydrogenase (NADP+)/methenyltetrahydrofolate cyclohydrolase